MIRPTRRVDRSEILDREMPVLRYGDRGPALIYAPSSDGDETEFEKYGMPTACAPWVAAGRVQIFSIDACGPRGLFDDSVRPSRRMHLYAQFERYAVEELLPQVLVAANVATVGVVGCSYGGFVAANLLFKHPDRVNIACGLGGVYAHWHRLDGHHDDEVYFHTPLEYLPRLEDPRILSAIRATRGMILFAAERDHWVGSSLALKRVLEEKELPHELEVWPAPADHHERWWVRQIVRFLQRHYGEEKQ